jgi:hypothetical protein
MATGYFGFLVFFIKSLFWRVVVFGLVGAVAGLDFTATIYTMSIDPQDPKVTKAANPRDVNYVKQPGVPVIDPDTLYCGVCQVHVDPGTKHCKVC